MHYVHRLVVARYIAKGEVTAMLKRSMIIADPLASQTIRARAGLYFQATSTTSSDGLMLEMFGLIHMCGFVTGISRSPPTARHRLSSERIRNIYKKCFKSAVNHYYRVQKILDAKGYKELMKWVDAESYLDENSSEFIEILEVVKSSKKTR